MRILFINSVCGVGSTGRIVTDLANGAEAQGHACAVVYGIGEAKGVDKTACFKISSKADYYVSNLLSRLTGFTGIFNGLSTKKAIKYIKSFRPDVVHLHNLHGYYINPFKLVKYLTKANIPVIWTLHDCWTFTGNCSNYSYAGCNKWETHCFGCTQTRRYPKSWLFEFTSAMYKQKKKIFTEAPIKCLTTPSVWLAGEVKKSFLGNFKCIPIHNGMDVERFCIKDSSFKENNGLSDKRIVLGVANAWGEKKGLYDFYKLVEKLPEEYKLVLVGLNEKQMKELPTEILGISRTESIEELIDIYNCAEVFVNPSYEETFGMVTAEALLCGTPVITYDRTAVPEVADFPYGRAVPAGDIEGLLKEIVNLPKYDKNEVRASALKYARAEMIKKYLEVYETI